MTNQRQLDDGAILQQLAGQWEKILVAVIYKLSPQRPVVISTSDLLELSAFLQTHKLLTWGHADSIELRLVTPEEGQHIADHVRSMGGTRAQ